MLCKSILDSTERGGVHFVDPYNTSCLLNQTFHWFNSTDRMQLVQLERMKQLQNDCPRNCTCEAERMSYDETLIFSAKVDCSNLGLTELPMTLPHMTISLNVSNNNVSLNRFQSYASIINRSPLRLLVSTA